MKELLLHNFLFVVLTVLTIFLPVISIWLGLKIIGERRSLFRCGIAYFSALIISAIVTIIVGYIPFLNLLSPLVFFVSYLYVLKVLLDIDMVKAFVATAVSLLILIIIALATALLTGIWISLFEVEKNIIRYYPIHF